MRRRSLFVGALITLVVAGFQAPPAIAQPPIDDSVDIRVSSTGITTAPDTLPAGNATLNISTDDPEGTWLHLIRLNRGESLEDYLANLRTAYGDDDEAGLEARRAMAESVQLLGGAIVEDIPVTVDMVVMPGRHYLVDVQDATEPDLAERVRPVDVGWTAASLPSALANIGPDSRPAEVAVGSPHSGRHAAMQPPGVDTTDLDPLSTSTWEQRPEEPSTDARPSRQQIIEIAGDHGIVFSQQWEWKWEAGELVQSGEVQSSDAQTASSALITIADTPEGTRFQVTGQPTSGRPIVLMNWSGQHNEAILAPVRPGTTPEDLDRFFQSIGGGAQAEQVDSPFIGSGNGSAPISPGRIMTFTADYPPGEYAVISYVENLETGVMSSAEGTHALITIAPPVTQSLPEDSIVDSEESSVSTEVEPS
ncbi:hypothetical protein [Actinoalloteichus hymeniacidonis]|uniref:Uncharacterized protein n=1 Tax=Actinoalloteichus hymeniacidonis TaxID=340345 RepID=A0AAC9HSX0_9PSEU|nr:hypothetical protein [Actinoalloteichus hymeniacidonis]AOS64984.1 hypothetical protein TL08_20965 [Actinoalloteichus hymeniacidonis]MBB5906941.1 hypothetical protein [Actinoalloteichus hymeniacidonis]